MKKPRWSVFLWLNINNHFPHPALSIPQPLEEINFNSQRGRKRVSGKKCLRVDECKSITNSELLISGSVASFLCVLDKVFPLTMPLDTWDTVRRLWWLSYHRQVNYGIKSWVVTAIIHFYSDKVTYFITSWVHCKDVFQLQPLWHWVKISMDFSKWRAIFHWQNSLSIIMMIAKPPE